jgi:hypothetical protein
MWIQTTFGLQEDATVADIDRALKDLQRHLDPQDPGFVRIGAAQVEPALELTTVASTASGRAAALGTLPPVLCDFVHAFAAGQPGWDAGIDGPTSRRCPGVGGWCRTWSRSSSRAPCWLRWSRCS